MDLEVEQMDIISYSVASKVVKKEEQTRHEVLGEGVQGKFYNTKERIDSIEEEIESVNKMANKLIIQDSVNIMKAHAKLNAIARSMKYNMHNMVFDDLLDLSGIDINKSSGYTHNAVNGEITADEECIIETKEEIANKVPSKVVLTVDGIEDTNLTPIMKNNNTPAPYIISTKIAADNAYLLFDNNIDTVWKAPRNISVPNWFQIKFDTPKKITSYMFQAKSGAVGPGKWKVEASHTGDFSGEQVLLDSRTDTKQYEKLETRRYQMRNTDQYLYYRISVYHGILESYPIELIEVKFFTKQENLLNGKYYISRDNGMTWEPIVPNNLFHFSDSISPIDNKIRLKMELPNGSNLLNYALTWA